MPLQLYIVLLRWLLRTAYFALSIYSLRLLAAVLLFLSILIAHLLTFVVSLRGLCLDALDVVEHWYLNEADDSDDEPFEHDDHDIDEHPWNE